MKGQSEVVFLKENLAQTSADTLSKVGWGWGRSTQGFRARSKTARCQDLAPSPEAGGAALRSLGNPATGEGKWLPWASR